VVYAKHRCVAVLCLTFFLVFALRYPAGASTVTFQPAVTYPVGTAPRAVAVGDFNGDGLMDLVVANSGDPANGDDGNVSILLGNGDGTFQPAQSVVAGKNPFSVAVDDFNGDGRLDVVVANNGNSAVSVLLGNGNGTFQTHVDFATGFGPVSVSVGDFNGDQISDLAVAAHPANVVSVLFGNGDGTFQGHVDYATGAANPLGDPNAVVIADLNIDGKVDIIASHAGGFSILLGNGDGTFQTAIQKFVAFDTLPAFIADFNQDGKPDALTGFHRTGPPGDFGVILQLGNGDGTFQPSVDVRPGFAIAVADFNGDLKLDVVGVESGTLNLLLGNGNGTFQTPLNFSTSTGPSFGTTADINGDKVPDLVTVNNDNTISVLLNTTGADFSISAAAPTPGTVSRGHSSTSTLSLAHLNSFDNPVALTCSAQPAQSAPTCSFTPSSVTFDANGDATATLTINTGAATASLVPLGHNSVSSLFLWPVAVLGMVGAGFGSRCFTRRKLMFYLLGCVLFGGLIVQVGCGGSGGPGSTTYTITITGTSGSTNHSTTVPLIVN
jgi:FG-GAP-like repeat/FG-GAP repeat